MHGLIKALVFLISLSPSFSKSLSIEGTPALPGNGKHIVLLAGDHEYRSEEYLPMIAQILSKHHGYKTTVLFAQNELGHVDPNSHSQPGLEVIKEANVVILGLRFRDWSSDDFRLFDDAFKRGVSFISTRTSTHAFKTTKTEWQHYSFNSDIKGWEGGFGRQVLGETWVNHHGNHGKEGTLTVAEKEHHDHPVLNGVAPIHAPTDVYGSRPLSPECILLRGKVTNGLTPNSKPVSGRKNDTLQPVAWTRLYQHSSGIRNKVFTTTLGSGIDFLDPNLRRLIVNACYWASDLKVPSKAKVDLVNKYHPQHFKEGLWRKGLKPSDFLILKDAPFTLPHLKTTNFTPK